MPALIGYRWSQRNPWNWGAPYGGIGGADGQPDPDSIRGPYITRAEPKITYWLRLEGDGYVGFNVDTEPLPDVWLSREAFMQVAISDEVKAEIIAKINEKGYSL